MALQQNCLIKGQGRHHGDQGEQTTDERPTDPVLLFKANVYYCCLDTVISQLKDRFTDNVLTVFEQMCHFTHAKLLTEEVTATEEVADLCVTYGLDAVCVVRELNEFRHAYRSAHHLINMEDLLEKQRGKMTLLTTVQSQLMNLKLIASLKILQIFKFKVTIIT